jgi:transposase-like protein
MYVRGLSTRDVEACLEEAFGGRVLSKSAVSEVTRTLGEDFEAWRRRDLSSSRIVYLFLDGHYVRLREGTQESSGILCVYGITETGQKALLSLMLGEKESEEAWLDCLRDLVERGLAPPLLVIADGAPGLKKAVRKIFPKALFQRCQAHKLRNILCKVPKDMQRFLHKKLMHVFQEAPDYATALQWGKELIAEFEDRYPAAMECLAKDLDECLTCYKFPGAHWKRIRTTNLLERTFGESRRRTKVIPYFTTEQAGMNQVFATQITHSKNWRGIKLTPEIQLQLVNLREKLYKVPAPQPIRQEPLEEVSKQIA